MVASPDPQRVVGRDGFPEGSSLGKRLDAKIAPFHSGSSVSPGMKSQFFPIPRNQAWEFLPGHGLDKVVTPRLPTERLGLQMCQCVCTLGESGGAPSRPHGRHLRVKGRTPHPSFYPRDWVGFHPKHRDMIGQEEVG